MCWWRGPRGPCNSKGNSHAPHHLLPCPVCVLGVSWFEDWCPGSGRSPGEGNGNPLQYSYLENPHGQRSLARYSLWGCRESDATERLSSKQPRTQERGASRPFVVSRAQPGPDSTRQVAPGSPGRWGGCGKPLGSWLSVQWQWSPHQGVLAPLDTSWVTTSASRDPERSLCWLRLFSFWAET